MLQGHFYYHNGGETEKHVRIFSIDASNAAVMLDIFHDYSNNYDYSEQNN